MPRGEPRLDPADGEPGPLVQAAGLPAQRRLGPPARLRAPSADRPLSRAFPGPRPGKHAGGKPRRPSSPSPAQPTPPMSASPRGRERPTASPAPAGSRLPDGAGLSTRGAGTGHPRSPRRRLRDPRRRRLREREPALIRRYARAMLLTETGSVREPGRLIEACEALFTQIGGRRLRGSVSRLRAGREGLDPRPRRTHVDGAAGVCSRLASPRGTSPAASATASPSRPSGATTATTRAPGQPAPDLSGARHWRSVHHRADGRPPVRVLSGVELNARHAAPNHGQIEAASREAAGTLRLGGPLDNEPWLGSRPATRTACR